MIDDYGGIPIKKEYIPKYPNNNISNNNKRKKRKLKRKFKNFILNVLLVFFLGISICGIYILVNRRITH